MDKKKIQLPEITNYTAIDNAFMHAVTELSLPTYRIFALLASQIRKSDDSFLKYEIRAEELKAIFGCKNKVQTYRILNEAVEEMLDIKVSIETDEVKKDYNWLNSSSYLKNDAIAILQFNDELKPFLLRLKRKYSQIWLGQTFRFSSHNTLKTYLFLCKKRNMKDFNINFIDLKHELKVLASSYKYFTDVERKILRPAQKEIHNKTLLQFEYNAVKSGRKLEHINFKITLLKPTEHKPIAHVPKLEKLSEEVKLKDEYLTEKAIYGKNLLFDATIDEKDDFKKSLGDLWAYSFEGNTPLKNPFMAYLVRQHGYPTFEEWMEERKEEKLVIG